MNHLSRPSLGTVLVALCACLLVQTSCFTRELDKEENYVNARQEPSLGDNEILRFKTFKLDNRDGYIIFGNNNEISLDGSAQLELTLFVSDGNRAAVLDLAGSTYIYETKLDKLEVQGAVLRSEYLRDKKLIVDATFTLRRQSQASQEERFILQLKQLKLPSGGILTATERHEEAGQLLGLGTEFAYPMTYYRN